MKPPRLLTFVVALLAALLGTVGSGTGVHADSPPAPTTSDGAGVAGDSDTQIMHADYDSALAEQADLLRKLSNVVQRREALTLDVFNFDQRISRSADDLEQARLSLLSSALEQGVAAALLEEAQARVDRSAAELHRQVANSYVHGGAGTEGLDTMFDVSGSERSGESLTYSNAVVDRQRRVISDFHEALAERNTQAQLTAVGRLAAEQRRREVTEVKAKLEREKLDLVVALNDLTHQQVQEQVGFSALEVQKVAIVDKVLSLPREPDRTTAQLAVAHLGEPAFQFPDRPMIDPVPGSSYTQTFGPQRDAAGRVVGFHPGIDLAGPTGTPIHAAADGVVLQAGPFDGYGKAVIIDHGSHLATLYGHQSVLNVQAGQRVKQGDIIGQRGSTGFSTGPHLHFETRVNGVPVDPLLFMRLPIGTVAPEQGAPIGPEADAPAAAAALPGPLPPVLQAPVTQPGAQPPRNSPPAALPPPTPPPVSQPPTTAGPTTSPPTTPPTTEPPSTAPPSTAPPTTAPPTTPSTIATPTTEPSTIPPGSVPTGSEPPVSSPTSTQPANSGSPATAAAPGSG